MIIQPKIRGFICTTAHPVGCFKVVQEEVGYVKSQARLQGPKNVLVIGASTGYGLASRIVATFASGANTIGVFFEKAPESNRTASPGWYNSAAFETLAHRHHYYAKSINGDAFSLAIKQKTAELIRQDLKKIDLIIYSLASPRRKHPLSGELLTSVLKPLDEPFSNKTIDAFRGEVKNVLIEPAQPKEIADTVAVMGGEDWEMWIDFLNQQHLLAEGVKTIAYSYIGPSITHTIYRDGTIGKAKEHLKLTADKLNQTLKKLGGEALISVNKAVVTQASAAIPVVPLYIALLFKVMKEKHLHEGCIEQMYRLFKDHLYAHPPKIRDAENNIRIDELEMRADVQQSIAELWPTVNSDNLKQLADVEQYCNDFYRLFGFNVKEVDYQQDINPMVTIHSLV